EVLRTLQALSARPPPVRALLRDELVCPSCPRDHLLGGHHLRNVERAVKQLGDGEKADGRLVVLEEPVQRAFRLHLRSAPPGSARSRLFGRGLPRKQYIRWSFTIPTACMYA